MLALWIPALGRRINQTLFIRHSEFVRVYVHMQIDMVAFKQIFWWEKKMNQITGILKNMGSSDRKRNPDYTITDIATTLLSRDYKGLSNYGSNGVIEIEEKKRR